MNMKTTTSAEGYAPPAPIAAVVVEGIPVGQMPNQYSEWTTGLCDCFSDMRTCCLVCWCPCVAFGRIAEIVDEGNTTCWCRGSLYMLLYSLGLATAALTSVVGSPTGAISFQWILSFSYRMKLKQNLNMVPSCWADCCTHFWCEPCALCQEYRELQTRGYDLSLGWEGNVNKPPVVFAPEVPTMNR